MGRYAFGFARTVVVIVGVEGCEGEVEGGELDGVVGFGVKGRSRAL